MVVIVLTIFVCGWFYLRDSCAGILEQPMGAKNRLWRRVVVYVPPAPIYPPSNICLLIPLSALFIILV